MTDETREANEANEPTEAIAFAGRVLGALFSQDPKEAEAQPVLDQLAALTSLDDWPFGSEVELGEAYGLISEGLATSRTELAREYQRLFIGPHAFKAPAWGSVYLDHESVLFGSSTLELRQWMRANGIVINEEKREPEDQIGKMLLLMGWLAEEKPDLLPIFLSEHLMPWVSRYLELLEEDARQPFYKGLAVLTRTTLAGIVAELDVEVTRKKLYR
jgi:TorA maturation chaperone TorD